MKNMILLLAALASVNAAFFSATAKPRQAAEISAEPNPVLIHQYQLNEQKIAVTEAGYDDTALLLDSLGWTYTEIQNAQLSNYELIKEFDVIFINCSDLAIDYADSAPASLEQFVREGGTLYSSDWAYLYIDKAFPGYINFFDDPYIGAVQSVTADIVDPGLRQYLDSSTLNVQMELELWVPIESVSNEVRVYVSSDFQTMDGETISDKPLSVSFSYGEGRVLYTSYHNEPDVVEATVEQKELFNYLVLISTTEELSAELQEAMTAKGYTLQEEILHTISQDETSDRYIVANETLSNLAIGLNWKEGILRLSVFKPDGSLYIQEQGTSPLIIEIPNAEAGDWSYEVYGVDVPYTSYPYVVQLGTAEVIADLPEQDTGQMDKRIILLLVIACVICSISLLVMAIIIVLVVLKKRRK